MRTTSFETGVPESAPISVRVGSGREEQPRKFSEAFRIGRSAECELCIPDDFVSRIHAEVVPVDGGWRVRDLNSSNGLYWNGDRVDDVLIKSGETLRLGVKGPELSFTV